MCEVVYDGLCFVMTWRCVVQSICGPNCDGFFLDFVVAMLPLVSEVLRTSNSTYVHWTKSYRLILTPYKIR